MSERVLVTGGGGFVGSHLVDRLLEEGCEVRVLDNFSTGRRENLLTVWHDIEVVEGDVRSYERAHTAVRGCDVVLHQAALPSVPRSIQDPLTTNAVNVVGTLNVLLAARDSDVRRVVCASSSSVYGLNSALPKTEEDVPKPASPYAVGKLAAETYCRSFSEVYGLDTVALRYFNVYGPRQDPLSQYAAVVPKFVTAFLTGEPPTIYGDGEQSRDFTYVDNVVDANVLAMSTDEARGHLFNVACGESVTLNQLVDELGKVTGRELEPVYEPERIGEVRHSLADITAAKGALGFDPRIGLEEGLSLTIPHFRERAAEPLTTA